MVYDWLGSIRELPPFFSIHRPLATSAIPRQEIVRRNEGVFVRDLVRASKILWKLTIYKVRWYLLSTTLQIKIYNNSYLINGLYFNFHGWFILIWKYLFFHRPLKNNNFYLILLGKNMSGCGFNNSEFCFKEHCDIIWREVYTSSQLNLIMAYMVVHYQLC